MTHPDACHYYNVRGIAAKAEPWSRLPAIQVAPNSKGPPAQPESGNSGHGALPHECCGRWTRNHDVQANANANADLC